jgi:hypothetical protein
VFNIFGARSTKKTTETNLGKELFSKEDLAKMIWGGGGGGIYLAEKIRGTKTPGKSS